MVAQNFFCNVLPLHMPIAVRRGNPPVVALFVQTFLVRSCQGEKAVADGNRFSPDNDYHFHWLYIYSLEVPY